MKSTLSWVAIEFCIIQQHHQLTEWCIKLSVFVTRHFFGQTHIHKWENTYNRSQIFFRSQNLCHTLSGNHFPLLTITALPNVSNRASIAHLSEWSTPHSGMCNTYECFFTVDCCLNVTYKQGVLLWGDIVLGDIGQGDYVLGDIDREYCSRGIWSWEILS